MVGNPYDVEVQAQLIEDVPEHFEAELLDFPVGFGEEFTLQANEIKTAAVFFTRHDESTDAGSPRDVIADISLRIDQRIVGGFSARLDACLEDLNDDNVVDTSDLLILLGSWGTDPDGPPDFDGDGDVDASDLISLLGAWGPCP